MEQKCQDIHCCQKRREADCSMSKIMLQMISLLFESIIVFIFNLPASSPAINYERQCFRRYWMIGDKRIVIDLFSASSVCDRYLDKVYRKGVFPVSQGYTLCIAVCVDLMFLPVKPVFNFFLGNAFYPFIQCFMGIRLTDKDKIISLFKYLSAPWLMSIQIVA